MLLQPDWRCETTCRVIRRGDECMNDCTSFFSSPGVSGFVVQREIGTKLAIIGMHTMCERMVARKSSGIIRPP